MIQDTLHDQNEEVNLENKKNTVKMRGGGGGKDYIS